MTLARPTGDGTGLVAHDPWLEPYADRLRERYAHYRHAREQLEEYGGLLGPLSQGHHYFGLNRGDQDGRSGVWYREWAPAAQYLALIGDFNGWDRGANPLTRDEWGVWSLFLPDDVYRDRLTHGSMIKVHVYAANGAHDRIPAYIRRVVKDEDSPHFTGQYWEPATPYVWNHTTPVRKGGLRIYEAHVGMAQEEARIGTYAEFTANILPRIADLGYNAIQLMAIAEHPYYGSFGYHVSSFFAPSSRFGTPEELKALIDAAHGMGIQVIMDLVHSHAVSNVDEGLNHFDGTEYQYFHAGPRGHHRIWDSLCFDYAKYEVRRFLLSNVRYWLEEFKFDGFRFDGVTSMLYLDHGLGRDFRTYDEYFAWDVDRDAICYLMFANELLHDINPHALSIAEDVSGMIGLARPISEGGFGFDYRLAMGIADYWTQQLKAKTDTGWNVGAIYKALLDRRPHENHIAYVESHDQALVGDKTFAFRLMDREMYWNMEKDKENLVVDLGVAILKLMRLLTFSLGGEGYLNFMGNEFGHPEWIDFPRAENEDSYLHARRQWSLANDPNLRYGGLLNFDRALQRLDQDYDLLSDPFIELLALHQDTRQLIYRRGPLVFVVNMHPTESYSHLRIPAPDPKDYRVVLDTDALAYGGHGRLAEGAVYPRQQVAMYGRNQSVQMYLPANSAQVLAPLTASE